MIAREDLRENRRSRRPFNLRPHTGMRGLRACLLMLVTLLVANGALYGVLESNLRTGVYPPDADSISIPLFSTVSVSVLILLAASASISLPKRSRSWNVLRSIAAAMAVFLSLKLSTSWLIPDHYCVSAAFAAVTIACIWSWWQSRLNNPSMPCLD